MARYSNNVKALLFVDNFQQLKNVSREKCITIQSYEYILNKSRKQNGEPYKGMSAGSVLKVALRIGSRDSMSVFYSRLKDYSPSSFSFIFDAFFDEDNMLLDGSFANAMIVDGYVVNVDECYNEDEVGGSDDGEQLSLVVNILINSVKYVGLGRNVTAGMAS